jgi:hypothetical protein
MTQRWNGEIKLPITHTPGRVLPILLRTGSLIAPPRGLPSAKPLRHPASVASARRRIALR